MSEITNPIRKELEIFIRVEEEYLYENKLLNSATKTAFDRILIKLAEVLK